MVRKGYSAAAAGVLLAFSIPAIPSESVWVLQPVVYQDQYISVRSSIGGVEDGTHHLGDVLTAYINLEYDPRRVRTLNLDETLLEQAWGEVPGIHLLGEPRVSTARPEGDLTGIEAEYDFQLLGCPDGSAPPCPGGKVFPLPNLSLGIELVGDDGRAVSSTDVDFRPWPGYASLASALALREGDVQAFEFYFPRRAFGMPVPVELNPAPAIILALAGFLALGSIGFTPLARAWMRHRLPARVGILGARWERALDRLRDEDLSDEEFWEGIRLAVDWYYHDKYGGSTLEWLEVSVAQGPRGDDETERLKALYLESMAGGPAIGERRKTVLDELAVIFEHV